MHYFFRCKYPLYYRIKSTVCMTLTKVLIIIHNVLAITPKAKPEGQKPALT